MWLILPHMMFPDKALNPELGDREAERGKYRFKKSLFCLSHSGPVPTVSRVKISKVVPTPQGRRPRAHAVGNSHLCFLTPGSPTARFPGTRGLPRMWDFLTKTGMCRAKLDGRSAEQEPADVEEFGHPLSCKEQGS